ncbi:MAG: carboxynorspermidine decarboxylase [Elusimicrobiota bacterium]|jgi:carboxynorspermidine decarboxylase|nr:carboxynorspermidine decarboxylase [Elusimicrobiota bacterium]
MQIKTPYYLIDEKALLKNMRIIERIKKISGAKFLLALKCFSTWSVFDLLKKYMDGTTSSSVYEARLGYEKFGGHTHAFSVAYSKEDIEVLKKFSDTIIFNSVTQLNSLYKLTKNTKAARRLGLRINPSISYSHFDLADPARKFSRLGEIDIKKVEANIDKISGAMFHYNCENADFKCFSKMLDAISLKYGAILKKLKWVSLGGGIFFTKENYPIEKFANKLKEFSETFELEIFLEPGEAAITNSASLVTKVLDIVENEKNIAIVDSSIEAHALDLLIYNQQAKLNEKLGKNEYIIAGKSCLAGDVFGHFKLARKLKVGSIVKFRDMAGYTMVKKNWFNGLVMPSIVVKRLSGKVEIIKEFSYKNFVDALS